ncbi:ABC transporter permease [Nocardia huaxiensis]|uniref:ABC transporter permease n=1 Tax=Nocardia huaxiensis TaxID=2755382 RepID=UPI001E617097|nr:ABC transporter permease [Nocardia huaxiensis]UFS98420.1 ABC transporter permease [Nocardia huaxiensis]
MKLTASLAIASTDLRRTFRQRSNYFFVFAFPMLLILVLGLAYGGGYEPRVGLVVAGSGPYSQRLAERITAADGIGVLRADTEAEAVTRVERGELEAAVIIPSDYDAAVSSTGDTAAVRYIARPGPAGQQVKAVVSAAAGHESGLLRAARFAVAETGADFGTAVDAADTTARQLPDVTVTARTAGTAVRPEGLGRFDVGASQELLLFVFVTSLTTATALIDTRRLGVGRRMLATANPAWVIVFGSALGRFGVAVVQGVFIVLGSAVIFGVHWGEPVAATALMLAFSLTAAAAGMLLGVLSRTVQQSVAIGLLLGLGVAALGGAMMPLEFFGPALRVAAHLTPHAWALDGYADLVRRGGGITDILPELGALLLMALALFTLSARRLRRSFGG